MSLVRGIRRWDLVALIINNIIGAGIFGLPSKVYALAGTYSIFALLACAVVVSLFESQSKLDAFGARLMPILQDMGIEAKATVFEVHNIIEGQ